MELLRVTIQSRDSISILLYGCVTWPMRMEDIEKLSAFESCLRYILLGVDKMVSSTFIQIPLPLGIIKKSLLLRARSSDYRWLVIISDAGTSDAGFKESRCDGGYLFIYVPATYNAK